MNSTAQTKKSPKWLLLPTATTIALQWASISPSLLPLKYYQPEPIHIGEYAWEQKEAYYSTSGIRVEEIEKMNLLYKFAETLIKKSKAVDPDINNVVSRNFWEMV